MYWFTTKKSSKTKTIKIPQLIVQAEAASEDMIESSQEEISL